MQTWVEEELAAIDIGDVRLNNRCSKILSALAARPSMSIPTACGGWTETNSAYRFFDNESVDPQAILQPHRESTLKRMEQESVVIVAQDTTILNLTRPVQQMDGAGPLSDATNHGMFNHVSLAVNPCGVPLGVLSTKFYCRDWETFHAEKKLTKSQKAVAKRHVPFTDKESYRWLAGYMQGCEAAKRCPSTKVIVVSDSEADIIDCFAYAQQAQSEEAPSADWITRAYEDRALVEPIHRGKLWDVCAASPVVTHLEIEVSKNKPETGDKTKRNQSRQARITQVEVRATTVTVKGQPRIDGKIAAQQINAVYVLEPNPPDGEKPVEWLLLTNLSIGSVEEISNIIGYYVLRWKIEIYFRILKVGCGVEKLQFETTERYERCLAVYMIVAWRVFYLMMLGRECPDITCEGLLEPEEWKALYVIANKTAPPSKPPKLGEVLILIAKLGGFLARKGDGHPGPKAMWIGIQRLRDFGIAWKAFGPNSKKSHSRSV